MTNKDISGAPDGAAGISGLLYVKFNDAIYVPFYDAYGNVMKYLAADGSLAASYVYDAFGRTVSQTGPLADVVRFRYSTKSNNLKRDNGFDKTDKTRGGYGEEGHLFDEDFYSGYVQAIGGFDDCIMRKAINMVSTPMYSLVGRAFLGFQDKYNCQDFCADLRRKYEEIKDDSAIKKQCCKESR